MAINYKELNFAGRYINDMSIPKRIKPLKGKNNRKRAGLCVLTARNLPKYS